MFEGYDFDLEEISECEENNGVFMKKIFIRFICLSFCFTVFAGCFPVEKKKELHVAMVGPLTGKSASAGKSHRQGINLYIDRINRDGGINGKKVILNLFDDQNNAVIAKEKAIEVADKSRSLGIIGHNYSSCSIAGGTVYKDLKVPAISPSSTNVKVTLNNDWYFRTVFNNNLQGRFLANYSSKVLKQKHVSIIHEDLAYGTFLSHVFEETSKELGVSVNYRWQFRTKDKHLDRTLLEIAEDVKSKKNAGLIFLATHAPEGVKLVKVLKDVGVQNVLMAPNAYATRAFKTGFSQFSKEKVMPGYYTNGVYVTTPLIFDTANDKAQTFKEAYRERYQETPDWHAAYSYDTAMMLCHALLHAGVSGKKDRVHEDRRKIRDYLAGLTSIGQAVRGVTGFNYYNEDGDSLKPVPIGIFRNGNIISALTQLQSIPNLNEISDLDKALTDERVLYIDGKYMYKTNVIYTGIKVNEISELNLKDLTCIIDFHLWFRFSGDIHTKDIEFVNAVEPVNLGTPEESKVSGQMTYHAYHIRTRFKADYLSGSHEYGQHLLGISFRHRELARNNLIYVTDMLGLGLIKGDTLYPEQTQILNPSIGWTNGYFRFYQDIDKRSSLGDPEYLNARGGTIECSRFNMNFEIKKNDFSLRRIIPAGFLNNLLIAGSILVLLIAVVFADSTAREYLKLFWFIKTITVFLFLISAEVALLDLLKGIFNTYYLELAIQCMDILWWIIVAFLLNQAVECFLWTPLEKKTERVIPNVVRRFMAFIVYVLAILGIIAFVYDQKITSLLATSGVLAMIIGLAIQINISNIFSGIIINIEHPFRVGDWIKIDPLEEGKVVNITWRTTRIQTRDGNILSIPNSKAAEAVVMNYCYPNQDYRIKFIVHVHPKHSPDRVKKILLDALQSTEIVLKEPKPVVLLDKISEWSSDYRVFFWFYDYATRVIYTALVWDRIWTNLKYAGIEPAIPRSEFHFIDGMEKQEQEFSFDDVILRENDIFKTLSEDDTSYVVQHMESQIFEKQDVIRKEGDVDDALYIIKEGGVGVWYNTQDDVSQEVTRMGVGESFGNILSLEPRATRIVAASKTHIYKIKRTLLDPLIKSQPEMAVLISESLAKENIKMDTQKEIRSGQPGKKQDVKRPIFSKIRTFLKPQTPETHF